LAICRGFVEALGGHIVATNRPDRRGAVLTITMPVPVQRPPLPEPQSAPSQPTETRPIHELAAHDPDRR
jgi:hypothetical protein